MCGVKALNPQAQEWWPTPPPPPPLLLPYHLFHPAPPPGTTTTPPHFYPYSTYHTICHQPSGIETTPKKGYSRRVLPPRLRPSKTPPPPQAKQEWKPKKTAKAVSNINSGYGGASHSPAPSYTTVMIKNIPNQLRRDFMLRFLDGHCKAHSLEYDFFYLPMDFRMKHNLGYAFVNFTTAVAANKFKMGLQNYKWGVVDSEEGRICSKKICEITWARVQGKSALTRRFENSHFTCDDLEFLPVILDPARNGDDPNPPPPVTVGRLCGHH